MFPQAQVSGTPNNPQVSHGNDTNLVVRFYFNKIEEKPYIKINIPGDQKTEYDRPVNDMDKRRFANKWQQFMSQQQQTDGQTPLEDMGVSEAVARHLANFHITTVEQLANLNDTFMTQVGMGTRELQKKAAAYLNDIQGRKAINHLEKELKQRDSQFAVLKEQHDNLARQYQELVARLESSEPVKHKGRKKAE